MSITTKDKCNDRWLCRSVVVCLKWRCVYSQFKKIKDNEVIGCYNSVQYNGNRIDADVNGAKNITGVFKADTLYLKFTGFYDLKARGEAKLYKDSDTSLVWVLEKYKGEFYLPTEAALKRPISNPGGMDCNDKLSLLITSSLNYVTDEDRNLLKAIETKTEKKEVDPKLTQRFETYYNQAPFYKTSNEITDEEDVEMMEIPSDMCNFFDVTAIKLYLWKLRTSNSIKLCLLYTEITPDNGNVIFYTLSAENKIIDKLSIKGNCDEKGFTSEYGVDYINDENIIHIDKTDGQRVIDKKRYCINSLGRFEETNK